METCDVSDPLGIKETPFVNIKMRPHCNYRGQQWYVLESSVGL